MSKRRVECLARMSDAVPDTEIQTALYAAMSEWGKAVRTLDIKNEAKGSFNKFGLEIIRRIRPKNVEERQLRERFLRDASDYDVKRLSPIGQELVLASTLEYVASVCKTQSVEFPKQYLRELLACWDVEAYSGHFQTWRDESTQIVRELFDVLEDGLSESSPEQNEREWPPMIDECGLASPAVEESRVSPENVSGSGEETMFRVSPRPDESDAYAAELEEINRAIEDSVKKILEEVAEEFAKNRLTPLSDAISGVGEDVVSGLNSFHEKLSRIENECAEGLKKSTDKVFRDIGLVAEKLEAIGDVIADIQMLQAEAARPPARWVPLMLVLNLVVSAAIAAYLVLNT